MTKRSAHATLPAVFALALLLAVLSAPGAPLIARQGGQPAAGAPDSPPPTPQHAVLHRLLGEWKAQIEESARAGDKPLKSRASETVRTCCNGLFVLTDLAGKSKNQQVGGRGILGYDPARDRYLLTWADGRSTSLSVGEGGYDEANDTLTFVYERLDSPGGMQQVRDLFTWDGADRRSRTISIVGGDGPDRQLVSIRYRRK